MYRWLRLRAGSGKTTTIRYIIETLDLQDEDVAYISFTGKASMVLRDKGCRNSMTAHKLLYTVKFNAWRYPVFVPRDHLEQPYKLIVVDEVSMIPLDMWALLLSHGIPVIALGDPAQLPPIGEDNRVLEKPHVFLDEIMRQAQESEIIRLTMAIREGKPLTPMKGNEVQIIPKREVTAGMYLWADQVICALNATRVWINSQVRSMLYHTSDPVPLDGEKIICLKNDWNTMNGYEDPLINGMTGKVFNAHIEKVDNKIMPELLAASFVPEGYEDKDTKAVFPNLNMDLKLFKDGTPTITQNTFKLIPKDMHPREFDYGYCITGWKSQGSEYNKVLAFEESFPINKKDKQKFLYTVATRAKEKLVLVTRQ